MAESDSTFSDLKFRLMPRMAVGQSGTIGLQNSSLEKYDSLLDKHAPLRAKVDILHVRSFEKFIKTMDNTSKESTVKVSSRKLSTVNQMPPLTLKEARTTEKSTASHRNFSVKRSTHQSNKPIFKMEGTTSTNNRSVAEVTPLTTERREKNMLSSILLPDKSDKLRMATTLAKLKQIVDDCQVKDSIPDAPMLRALISSFESLMDKDSYYASVMQGFIDTLKKVIFVCKESRSQDINIILQLNNKDVNSIMFTEAGEGKLTHYECSQKILKAFLTWASAANRQITELEGTIKRS